MTAVAWFTAMIEVTAVSETPKLRLSNGAKGYANRLEVFKTSRQKAAAPIRHANKTVVPSPETPFAIGFISIFQAANSLASHFEECRNRRRYQSF